MQPRRMHARVAQHEQSAGSQDVWRHRRLYKQEMLYQAGRSKSQSGYIYALKDDSDLIQTNPSSKHFETPTARQDHSILS